MLSAIFLSQRTRNDPICDYYAAVVIFQIVPKRTTDIVGRLDVITSADNAGRYGFSVDRVYVRLGQWRTRWYAVLRFARIAAHFRRTCNPSKIVTFPFVGQRFGVRMIMLSFRCVVYSTQYTIVIPYQNVPRRIIIHSYYVIIVIALLYDIERENNYGRFFFVFKQINLT